MPHPPQALGGSSGTRGPGGRRDGENFQSPLPPGLVAMVTSSHGQAWTMQPPERTLTVAAGSGVGVDEWQGPPGRAL